MDTPKPRGWKGSDKDFSYLRTFDGHIATDIFDHNDPGNADFDLRRNARSLSNVDIGVENYSEGEY